MKRNHAMRWNGYVVESMLDHYFLYSKKDWKKGDGNIVGILFTPENEMSRVSILRIYHYENRQMCGTLENSYLSQKVYFQNALQFIMLLEELYNELNFPQATTETRSFISAQTNYLLTKQKIQQLTEQVTAARAKEKKTLLEQQHGEEGIPLATFILTVQYRSNSSWQGSISWKKANDTLQFRSLLELLHILDEVLLLLQSYGGSTEFGKMLKDDVKGSKNRMVE